MNVKSSGPKPDEKSAEFVTHTNPKETAHVDSYEIDELQLFCDMGPLDTLI